MNLYTKGGPTFLENRPKHSDELRMFRENAKSVGAALFFASSCFGTGITSLFLIIFYYYFWSGAQLFKR